MDAKTNLMLRSIFILLQIKVLLIKLNIIFIISFLHPVNNSFESYNKNSPRQKTEPVNVNLLHKKGDLWFQNNHSNPFTGVVFENSKITHNKILECEYRDGLLHGYYSEWYQSGSKKITGQYFKGKPNKCWLEWYPNGQLSDSINYLHGNRNGIWSEWYETGEKLYEGNFINDLDHGKHLKWFKSGDKAFEFFYKNGKKTGVWVEWYPNGQKMYENSFKEGVWDGIWMGWYKTGSKKYEIMYEDGEQIYQLCWDSLENSCDCSWYFENGCD